MTIEKAISSAIEGGWKSEEKHISLGCWETFMPENPHWKWKENEKPHMIKRIYLGDILLDPKFWQALARTKIYELDGESITPGAREQRIKAWAVREMHSMMDAVIGGKTVEQYFETL